MAHPALTRFPLRRPWLVLPFVAALQGCGADSEVGERSGTIPGEAQAAHGAVVDAAGRAFSPDTPPSRILSLVPSATEALLALGQRPALVGRTDFDTTAALASLPSVGGGLDPALEVLVSLEPDLVIRFAGPADTRTPARLDDLGIPHFAVRPERVADVLDMIRDLGRLTHRTSPADSLLGSIRAQLQDVQERVAEREPVPAAFLLSGTPPWAAGPASFIGELMTLGGGANAFHDLERPYAPVSAEELLHRGISVVLTTEDHPPQGIPASAVVRQVSSLTQLPGPRLGEAAEEIARALHPDAFR